MPGTGTSVSVVIPARNAERTIERVVRALLEGQPSPHEIIVVDDGSTDPTAEIAAGLGYRVTLGRGRWAGGARNDGWEAASGDVVLFLDSDAIPAPGFAAGLDNALSEFPGAIVGCARTFTAHTAWGWVAHLQAETPYLPAGEPRKPHSYRRTVWPCRAWRRCDGTRAMEGRMESSAWMQSMQVSSWCSIHAFTQSTIMTADVRGPAESTATPGVRSGAHRSGSARGVSQAASLTHPASLFCSCPPGAHLSTARSYPELQARFWRLFPHMAVAEWTLGGARFATCSNGRRCAHDDE